MEGCDEPAIRAREAPPMDERADLTPEEHHAAGNALLDQNQGEEAFEHLSRAYLSDPQNARYRSSYALALALVKGQFLGAAELARAAVRQEYHNPDLYLSLARIYLAFDFRAEAVRFLRRGLMVDPGHERITEALTQLGIRRPPALRFLPRRHILNRLLGRLQARTLRATRPTSSGIGA
jgi:tetratricopeptide (TPR) repeat protein